MANQGVNIGQKIWSMADVLRDAGVGADAYLDQITLLLFVKMVNEQASLPKAFRQNTDWGKIELPDGYTWNKLVSLKGEDLLTYYAEMLKTFGNPNKTKGTLLEIYRGAENKIRNASLLESVIKKIDEQQWSALGVDVKGEIYESLLQRNGEDVKSGAGQYFTPRPLISTIVKCVNPQPDKKIADPCCGTGGFIITANKYIQENNKKLTDKQKQYLQCEAFSGGELVPDTYRLCLMNMILHGIGKVDSEPTIKNQDSLANQPSTKVDYVLTNPPFGKKTAKKVEKTVKNKKTGVEETRVAKEKDYYVRDDFFATTANKQFNFVMHIMSMLKVGGTAGIVLPDNVLSSGTDKAGTEIRRKLLKEFDLHTILRLPTGIFYAKGIKANVLFFEKRPASNTVQTKEVWVYDYRTNIHHTLVQNPMKEEHLKKFIECYNPKNRHERKELYNVETAPEARWRKFTYEEIEKRNDFDLDLKWLTPDSEFDDSLTISEVVQGMDNDKAIIVDSVDKIKSLLGDLLN